MSKAVESPVWPCSSEVAEALVRLLGRAEAGELAHRPEAAAVHRRIDASGERVLAGVAEVARVVDVDALGRRRAARSRFPRSSRRARPSAPARARRRSRARRRATRPRRGPRSSPSRRIVGAGSRRARMARSGDGCRFGDRRLQSDAGAAPPRDPRRCSERRRTRRRGHDARPRGAHASQEPGTAATRTRVTRRPTAVTASARRSRSRASRASTQGTSPAGSASAALARARATGTRGFRRASRAAAPGTKPFVYAEIVREGREAGAHPRRRQRDPIGRGISHRRPRGVAGATRLVACPGRRLARHRARFTCPARPGAGRRSRRPRAGTAGQAARATRSASASSASPSRAARRLVAAVRLGPSLPRRDRTRCATARRRRIGTPRRAAASVVPYAFVASSAG